MVDDRFVKIPQRVIDMIPNPQYLKEEVIPGVKKSFAKFGGRHGTYLRRVALAYKTPVTQDWLNGVIEKVHSKLVEVAGSEGSLDVIAIKQTAMQSDVIGFGKASKGGQQFLAEFVHNRFLISISALGYIEISGISIGPEREIYLTAVRLIDKLADQTEVQFHAIEAQRKEA